MYEIFYTKKASKDIVKLKAAKLADKTRNLLELIKINPFSDFPAYEALQGDLKGAYSRRINLKHRLVYEVLEDTRQIKIISMWSHYDF